MLRQMLDHYVTPTVTVYFVNDCGNRNSVVCKEQESAQEAPATVNRQTRGNLFGAFDSCVPFSLVFGGFLDLCEQRVLLAVGTCTALLLHRATVLTLTQECHYGLFSLTSETLLASSQSLNETEARQCDLSDGCGNGRSNHVVATCCLFAVFSSCCRFVSARCCVDDFGS